MIFGTIITIIIVAVGAIIAWKIFKSLMKVLMTVIMILLVISVIFGFFIYQDYKTVKEFRNDKNVYYEMNGTNYSFMKNGELEVVTDLVEPNIIVDADEIDPADFKVTSNIQIIKGLRGDYITFNPELYVSKFTGKYPNMIKGWFNSNSSNIEELEQIDNNSLII